MPGVDVSLHGNPEMLQMRLGNDHTWRTVDRIVFVVSSPMHPRMRMVIPEMSKIRNPKPRKVRARLIRDFLIKGKKSGDHALTCDVIDRIFCNVARKDAARGVAFSRLWLYAKGLSTKGLGYWL